MKRYLLVILIGLLFYVPFSVHAVEGHFIKVSAKNPHYFEYDDGTPYIPIGLNLCWIGISPTPEAGMEELEFYFRRLSENGGNYARVWLSCQLFEIEKDRPGNFSADALDRVEKMLQLAEKYNIRLKFCFEHFRNIGDKKSVGFRKAFYRSDTMKTIKDFVNSETGRSYYLNRCRQFEKFRDNPYVFGWEIWNEMNCLPDFYQFTEYVLPKLHEMFPRHLVMQSLGSFDHPSAFDYYPKTNKMAGNDVAQIHRYMDPGASLPKCKGPMDQLCADAVDIMRKIDPKRPILLAETGAVEKHHSRASDLYPLDKEGLLLHDSLFVPFFCGAAGTGHIWHWNNYVENNDLWYHIGRFSKAVKNINPLEENFEPFLDEQKFLRAYGLRGDKHILIFLRDQETNWKTELVDKTPAPVRNRTVFDLKGMAGTDATAVSCYDPWNDRETVLQTKNGKIVLPEFRRSLVLRITR